MADFSYLINKEPNKDELLQLLSDIAEKWYEIGEAINVSQDLLSGLKFNKKPNYYKLNDVLESWKLEQPSPVTWETVISAVEGPIVNNKRKANQIREHLGILPSTIVPALVPTQDPIPVDIFKRSPNLSDLSQRLIDVDNQWENIGKALTIPQAYLDHLRRSSLSDSGKLFEILSRWKSTAEPHLFTWETVIAAIEGPIVNNKRKANEIRQYLHFNKLMKFSHPHLSSQDPK